jgi:hypothetical protein
MNPLQWKVRFNLELVVLWAVVLGEEAVDIRGLVPTRRERGDDIKVGNEEADELGGDVVVPGVDNVGLVDAALVPDAAEAEDNDVGCPRVKVVSSIERCQELV